ncbi:MAG TPA: phosphonatase-like hydrolase [Microscillaceae bacterium]|nr:phosphonatase-like hydrolase [Microscillaceae bacterium]
MAIKLVVFDMAGTTVNDADNVHQALQNALQKAGYTATRDEVNAFMGYAKPIAIQYLLQHKGAAADQVANQTYIEQIHQDFVKEMVDFYRYNQHVCEQPLVRETFRELRKRGIKVAIDTGFSREIADVIMERLGWKQDAIFDYSVTSDEVPKGRPHPDMILKAMEQVGIQNADEVAKVGDTISDMEQGKAAKCKFVIGVTTGAYTKEELAPYQPTHLVDCLFQVIEIIDQEIEEQVA